MGEERGVGRGEWGRREGRGEANWSFDVVAGGPVHTEPRHKLPCDPSQHV